MANYYIATDGSGGNSGAIGEPWDITSALIKEGAVSPGDTLFLRAGTYSFATRDVGTLGFNIRLQGSTTAPIIIRNYPGERVVIDGGLKTGYDGYVSHDIIITGLEVIVNETLEGSRTTTNAGSDPPPDLVRPWGGININGTGYNISVIDNRVHHNWQGISYWGGLTGTGIMADNVVYSNGWIGPDRNHGHGFYSQNASDRWRFVVDNIMWDNFELSMQAYGSEAAYTNYYYTMGNMFAKGPNTEVGTIQLGGSNPSNGHKVYNNYGIGISVGFGVAGTNALIKTNRMWNGHVGFYSGYTKSAVGHDWAWDKGWSKPREAYIDSLGRFQSYDIDIPTDVVYYLRPFRSNARWAKLVVFNFPGVDTTTVDLSSFLSTGDNFSIFPVDDPEFDNPITEGGYTGDPVAVTLTEGSQATGSTDANISIFLVQKSPTSNSAPAFTTAAGATFVAQDGNFAVIRASGHPAPTMTFTGTLPTGVVCYSVNDGAMILAGTPQNTGTFTLTITATSNQGTVQQTFVLTVVSGTNPAFTSASSVTFSKDVASSFTVTASGKPTPLFGMTAPDIALGYAPPIPGGLLFDGSTGVISGTPTVLGSFPITFNAENGRGPNLTQNFTLNVVAGGGVSPQITSGNSASFTVGSNGSFTVTATGTPTPTFSRTGALPAGVNFNTTTGVLSGTPQAGTAGTYPITFTALNGVTPNATVNFTLTVRSAPAITSANAATFYIGGTNSHQVVATGSPAPTVSRGGDALPSGVTFNTTTKVLSGTPTGGAGTYNLTFTATNGIGSDAVQNFTLTVASATAPVARPDSLTVISGQSVSASLVVNDTASVGSIAASTTAIVTPPAHGTATLNNGVVTYTPARKYVGGDSFTYRVKDTFGNWSNIATVTVTVTKAGGKTRITNIS